jgi:parvulin-like peptidyl-prolyl isomerase
MPNRENGLQNVAIHSRPSLGRHCLFAPFPMLTSPNFTHRTIGVMRPAMSLLVFALCCCFAGCNALQKKHDSPVMAAAPVRVPEEPTEDTKFAGQSEDTKPQKEFDGSDLKQVSATLRKNPWDDWEDDTTIFNSQVAATVNGAPVLNGDILDRYGGYLLSIREQMQKAAADPKYKGEIPGPDQYEKLRYAVIQREIAVYIQRKVLVERLKSGMKPEQLKLMESHIDDQFAKEIERLKHELKVNNKTELEIELNKKGTTLKNVRDNFALERLAGECVALKSEKPLPIERSDLLAYYNSHPDEFGLTAKVRWQQIQISISPALDKKAARKKMDLAVAELKKGVPFDTVAKKYSDGPTAKNGGEWDWMEEGNLADVSLEKKLFSMPVNVLSDIHENAISLHVVKVTERQEAGRKKFKEVQQEIHKILETEQNKNRQKKLFKELFSQAVIETQYEIPRFFPED